MKIENFKQLAWRYKFNETVTVDIERETVTLNGELITADSPQEIADILKSQLIAKTCRVHKIPKGDGSFRYVYAPNKLYKDNLRALLPELEFRLNKLDTRGMFHAFRSNYNPVTNGKAHIGYNYSAKFDLKSFFDTVHEEHLTSISKRILDMCLISGTTKQGLPTSPMLASIALLPHVYALEDELKATLGNDIMMTVYADDITVSFNDRMQYEDIKSMTYRHIKTAGFKINYKKTKLKFGHKPDMRRIICGVAVGSHDIQRTREVKRRIRKAIHKQETSRAAGLIEWAACKEPRSRRYNGL